MKLWIPCLIAIIVLLGMGAGILRMQHNALARALPPVYYVTMAEIKAMQGDKENKRDLVAVAGTGSMQPYIPAGSGIVAYVEREHPPFGQLRKGDLVVFRAGVFNILHQLVSREGEDWIAAGLHNSHYDNPRVTADNLMGRVTATYILK